MTNIEQLAALVNAGFTKAEIMGLLGPATAPAAVPDPTPAPAPATDPTPEPEQPKTPEPAKAPEPTGPMVTDDVKQLFGALGMKLDTLTTAIHNSNLTKGVSTVNESTDDILAKIINPYGGDVNGN